MHSTGSGRKKRYDEDTLKALTDICSRAARKESAEQIEYALSQMLTRSIEVPQNGSSRAVAVPQNLESIELLARTLETLTGVVDRLVKLEEYNSLPWYKKIINKRKAK